MTSDRTIETAVEATRAAGEVLLQGFAADDKRARAKGHPHNPVTVYDGKAEDAIVRVLSDEHPDDGILSEETVSRDGTSGRRWIIDPLDGTNNFLAGIPHFAVSIALEDARGTVLGCVHDPVRGETFTAVRGDGARLGEAPLRVSRRETLDGAVLSIGLSFHPDRRARILRQLPPLLPRASVLRTLGSAALDLAYIAAGRYDAAWYIALHTWDVAAGALLVEEAGGRLTDLRGAPLHEPLDGIAASNGILHDEFLHALAE